MEKNEAGLNSILIINKLPSEGFLRLNQIVGNKNCHPIIPISKSSWWAGVKKGIYPKPIKLSKRTTVWKISDIRKIIDGVNCHE
jgi:prophage regulatory protein